MRGGEHPSMRVLMVTNLYPTPELPSAGTFVRTHVEGLRAAGLDVDVLHLARAETGRRVYRGLAEAVRQRVADFDPTVVHVSYGGVMADIVTRALPEQPVVVSFCGTDLLGGGSGGLLERASVRFGVVASRRAAGRATAIIVMSRNLLEALPSRALQEEAQIIPYGVDLTRFLPRDRALCRTELAWDPERRHVLFPASPARAEKRFWLAEAAVERLRGTGVPVELHALDGVPRDDVPTWINASDVVVLTSAYEGSPNAVKEALACNVAVVSVDVGDVRERLDGIAGCELAEATPTDVADKLARALERERPVDGRARVAEFSVERTTVRVLEVYDAARARKAG